MKEALKLALEALWTTANPKAEEAITAIKAALAQQEPWCMKMNGCKTKCEDCPDEPAQRPWVGLTEAQFLEAVRLAENGNYLVAFVRIQEWLKEQNT